MVLAGIIGLVVGYTCMLIQFFDMAFNVDIDEDEGPWILLASFGTCFGIFLGIAAVTFIVTVEF